MQPVTTVLGLRTMNKLIIESMSNPTFNNENNGMINKSKFNGSGSATKDLSYMMISIGNDYFRQTV